MTADTASITYTITAYTAAGTTTITKIQSFSKSKTGATGGTITGPGGANAPRIATGFVYSVQNSTAPNSGASIVYSFTGTTGFGSTLNNNWSETPPTFNSTNNTIYYSLYTATEGVTNNTRDGNATGNEVTFSAIGTGTSFTGLVTFAGEDFSTSAGTITTIDGGNIKSGSISATQLAISNNASGSAGIYMDATTTNAPKIEIRDANAVRVVLGKLS